jgi:hypothetical protein
MWQVILTFLLSVAGGIFYHLGGTNKGTLWRDLCVPTIMSIYLILTGHFHWSLFLCFGLLYAGLTWSGKKKGTEGRWYNWAMLGLAYSCAMIPMMWFVGSWAGFFLRTVVLTAWTVGWSEYEGNAVREEFGRGFGIIATLPLLFIGTQ